MVTRSYIFRLRPRIHCLHRPTISCCSSFDLKRYNHAARIFDEKTFVPGSLSIDQMETMVKSLKHQLAVYKKKDDPMLSERTVDEALQKIEMLVAESSSFMMDHHQSRRRVIVDAELIHSFVMFWKKVALVQKHKTKAESILNPHQLLIKLHALSRKQTELRYETRTIGLLLDVVIGTAENPQSAPELAEGWVQHLHSISETTNTTIPSIHRDVYTYSKTIQAWATSGRTDAPSRIDALWKQLQAEGIQLNEVTSNILLRFWGRHIDHGVGVEQIRAILSHMKDQKVEPSLANLAQAVYGFSRTHDRLKATEKLFFKMVRNKPRYKKEYQLIEESAIHVLLAHRKALDAAAHGTEKVKAISAAENFFTKAEKFAVEASSSLLSREAGKVSKLVVSMMDIYARAGLHGEVESLLNRIQPNLVVYSILIKSYGRYDMAEEAAAVLRRVLREAQIVPDIHLFNELINAYAESSTANAYERCRWVFKMIDQHPGNLRPDVYTFGTMFKCLSRVQQNDAGRQAADLILDMERRYKEGNQNVKPTSVSYTMAIKIALGVDDWETAEMLILRARTDSSESSILDVRAYNSILRFLSQRGTVSAAEHAERILKDHMTAPDVISFTTVMRAWVLAASAGSQSEERAYELYRHMKIQHKVAPNIVTFHILITFLSSLHTPEALAMAESLLNDMEESNEVDISPDHRHYIPVMTGYAEIQDALNARRILERYIADYRNRVDRDEITSSRPLRANFDVVFRAFLRSGDIDGATAFVDDMQKLKDDGKIPEGPDFRTYSGLLNAWKALSDEEDSERRDWEILRLQKIVDDLQWLL